MQKTDQASPKGFVIDARLVVRAQHFMSLVLLWRIAAGDAVVLVDGGAAYAYISIAAVKGALTFACI